MCSSGSLNTFVQTYSYHQLCACVSRGKEERREKEGRGKGRGKGGEGEREGLITLLWRSECSWSIPRRSVLSLKVSRVNVCVLVAKHWKNFWRRRVVHPLHFCFSLPCIHMTKGRPNKLKIQCQQYGLFYHCLPLRPNTWRYTFGDVGLSKFFGLTLEFANNE